MIKTYDPGMITWHKGPPPSMATDPAMPLWHDWRTELQRMRQAEEYQRDAIADFDECDAQGYAVDAAGRYIGSSDATSGAAP